MTKEEREKVIDALKISAPIHALTEEEFNDYIQTLNKAMDWLEQEPKTGHWISHYDEDEKEGWYECDRCHTERAFNTDYCPDCGCRMVDPQETDNQERGRGSGQDLEGSGKDL